MCIRIQSSLMIMNLIHKIKTPAVGLYPASTSRGVTGGPSQAHRDKSAGSALNAACGGRRGTRPRDGSGNPGLRVWATGCSITTDLKRGNETVGISKRRGCQTGAGMTKGSDPPLCSFAYISVALRHQRPCERYYFTKRNDSTNRNHST